eukprot:GHVU01016334.1.p1 GENE.GHVU01016334.1~~GHVU01016334.1.p1  ORF type:complete len:193 (-),score=12.00 GHVU01016334.1:563-1141(-)
MKRRNICISWQHTSAGASLAFVVFFGFDVFFAALYRESTRPRATKIRHCTRARAVFNYKALTIKARVCLKVDVRGNYCFISLRQMPRRQVGQAPAQSQQRSTDVFFGAGLAFFFVAPAFFVLAAPDLAVLGAALVAFGFAVLGAPAGLVTFFTTFFTTFFAVFFAAAEAFLTFCSSSLSFGAAAFTISITQT